MDDSATLAGITAATDDSLMPRIVETFDHLGYRVSIVEPVNVVDGKLQRGYLWHAVIGDFTLQPARPGLVDEDRHVPGLAVGGEQIAYSSKSVKQVVTNARRALTKKGPNPVTDQPELGPIDKAAITAKPIDSLMNSGAKQDPPATAESLDAAAAREAAAGAADPGFSLQIPTGTGQSAAALQPIVGKYDPVAASGLSYLDCGCLVEVETTPGMSHHEACGHRKGPMRPGRIIQVAGRDYVLNAVTGDGREAVISGPMGRYHVRYGEPIWRLLFGDEILPHEPAEPADIWDRVDVALRPAVNQARREEMPSRGPLLVELAMRIVLAEVSALHNRDRADLLAGLDEDDQGLVLHEIHRVANALRLRVRSYSDRLGIDLDRPVKR